MRRMTSEMEMEEMWVGRSVYAPGFNSLKERKVVTRKFTKETLENDIEQVTRDFDGLYMISGAASIGKTTVLPRLFSEKFQKRVIVICENNAAAVAAAHTASVMFPDATATHLGLSSSFVGTGRVAYMPAKAAASIIGHEEKYFSSDLVVMVDEAHSNSCDYQIVKELLLKIPRGPRAFFVTATPLGPYETERVNYEVKPMAESAKVKGRVLRFCESYMDAKSKAKDNDFILSPSITMRDWNKIVEALKTSKEVTIYATPEMSCGINLDIDYVVDCSMVVRVAIGKNLELVDRRLATPIIESLQRAKRAGRFGKQGTVFTDAKLDVTRIVTVENDLDNALAKWFKDVLSKADKRQDLSTKEQEAYDWLFKNLTVRNYHSATMAGEEWYDHISGQGVVENSKFQYTAIVKGEPPDKDLYDGKLVVRSSVRNMKVSDLWSGVNNESASANAMAMLNWVAKTHLSLVVHRPDLVLGQYLDKPMRAYNLFRDGDTEKMEDVIVSLITERNTVTGKLVFMITNTRTPPDQGRFEYYVRYYTQLTGLWQSLFLAFGTEFPKYFKIDYYVGKVLVKEKSSALLPDVVSEYV